MTPEEWERRGLIVEEARTIKADLDRVVDRLNLYPFRSVTGPVSWWAHLTGGDRLGAVLIVTVLLCSLFIPGKLIGLVRKLTADDEGGSGNLAVGIALVISVSWILGRAAGHHRRGRYDF